MLAAMFIAGISDLAAEKNRTPHPIAGAYETAVTRAYNYFCEDDFGNRVRGVVDSANAPALVDPNAIYIYQVPRGADPRSEQFRANRVLPECTKALGSQAHIVGGPVEVTVDWRRY